MKKFFVANLLALTALAAHAAGETITVYKDPDCGCCTAWAAHMTQAGYKLKQIDRKDMQAVKQRFGVPESLQSCHTAVIDATGQVLEGHVPAPVVSRLIADKSRSVKGLAVPGMSANSPGMGKMDGKLVTVDFAGKEYSRN
ncbi:CopG family transcriptional regulator [Herbaspirillum hiltneri N3]|uniref:CopG family transcriptional regulator n=1 Tax=Herbaspirillum hiltneri N3 TaxID=1262470 RepID=A0ABN4HU40_9BURK|nr:DUF411 domain-containing protein [Herbaspirillum hiltneri]AKZ62112.1 CopG family transcriptional regulator [Herbaspirillum hiltneri N3]